MGHDFSNILLGASMDAEGRFSPVKVVRWSEVIQAVLAGEQRGPIRANLDLTNLCQDRCTWCEPLAYRDETIQDRKHTLGILVALRVLQDLSSLGCRMVHFSGGGEPLLHRSFGWALATANLLGMRTFVVTNGGKLDGWLPELRAHADHIRVSLDASDQAEHTVIHGSRDGTFKRIWASLDALRQGEGRRPELGVGYVLTDENSAPASIERLMRTAEAVPLDFLQFRPVSEPEPKFLTYRDEYESWPAFASWALEAGRAFCPSVKVWTSGARANGVFHQRNFERCYSALTVAVIGADGRVSACCDERGIVFGSVYEKPFREIWLSEQHRRVAASIIPKLCVRCLQCGYNRAVEKYVVGNESLVEFV